jgi:hypothetical protein
VNDVDDIPHASTDQQTDADSVDLEANAADKSVSPTLDDCEMAAKDTLPNDIILSGIDHRIHSFYKPRTHRWLGRINSLLGEFHEKFVENFRGKRSRL